MPENFPVRLVLTPEGGMQVPSRWLEEYHKVRAMERDVASSAASKLPPGASLHDAFTKSPMSQDIRAIATEVCARYGMAVERFLEWEKAGDLEDIRRSCEAAIRAIAGQFVKKIEKAPRMSLDEARRRFGRATS